MEVFIIVKYMEKLKKKYTGFKQKRLAAYLILSVFSLIVIYILFAEDANEVKVLDEAQITTADTSKAGKVIYTVNNVFTELKNPFSFAHEQKDEQLSEPIRKTAESSTENKTVQSKGKIPLKQNTVQKGHTDEDEKANTIKQRKMYKVEAVFDINQQKSALLNVNGQEVRVQEGTEINGVTVTSITKNNVILQTVKGTFINCPFNNF